MADRSLPGETPGRLKAGRLPYWSFRRTPAPTAANATASAPSEIEDSVGMLVLLKKGTFGWAWNAGAATVTLAACVALAFTICGPAAPATACDLSMANADVASRRNMHEKAMRRARLDITVGFLTFRRVLECNEV